jgi:serine/threonine protein kinase
MEKQRTNQPKPPSPPPSATAESRWPDSERGEAEDHSNPPRNLRERLLTKPYILPLPDAADALRNNSQTSQTTMSDTNDTYDSSDTGSARTATPKEKAPTGPRGAPSHDSKELIATFFREKNIQADENTTDRIGMYCEKLSPRETKEMLVEAIAVLWKVHDNAALSKWVPQSAGRTTGPLGKVSFGRAQNSSSTSLGEESTENSPRQESRVDSPGRADPRPPSIATGISSTSSIASMLAGEVKELTNPNRGTDSIGCEKIGEYTLVDQIGRGNQGAVYLALDDQGEQHVVKKLFRGKIGRTGIEKAAAGKNQAVINEIDIMKRAHHKNIVPLEEVMYDEEEDQIFLVMPFADQGAIGKVEDNGSVTVNVPKENLRSYFHQAATGLRYLHQRQIIHRDVKPENILATSQHVCQLADFGVSAFLTTIPHASGGTLRYHSPELVTAKGADFKKYAKHADIWALGVTFYGMHFGVLPFPEPPGINLSESILTSKPAFPEDCPADLRDLLERMLKKNPEERITLRDVVHHSYFASLEESGRGGVSPSTTEGLESGVPPTLHVLQSEPEPHYATVIRRASIARLPAEEKPGSASSSSSGSSRSPKPKLDVKLEAEAIQAVKEPQPSDSAALVDKHSATLPAVPKQPDGSEPSSSPVGEGDQTPVRTNTVDHSSPDSVLLSPYSDGPNQVSHTVPPSPAGSSTNTVRAYRAVMDARKKSPDADKQEKAPSDEPDGKN